MKRRDFGRSFSVGTFATVCSTPMNALGKSSQPAKRALMKVGTQRLRTVEWDLLYLERCGVKNMCASETDEGNYYPGIGFDRDEILRKKERCESHGISLDLMYLPMSSVNIKDKILPNILLGKSPERDKEIDLICTMIKTASQAGISGLQYNLNIIEVLRTGNTPGRGGVRYPTWDFEKATHNPPMTIAGRVTADMFWERITYFLERVVPVATEYKVRLACHPHDPWVPQGYMGVDSVLSTVDGLKRFVAICPSPYHGFNFCVGTVSEMLENPSEEIFDIIRYFGEQKKLFNIHFRNIRGKRSRFMEVYPDEGDLNMYKVMKVLKEVDYPYMVMPDHIPYHNDDPERRQAYAWSFGYIKALIQAVDSDDIK
jgi:mannonate dehydratase